MLRRALATSLALRKAPPLRFSAATAAFSIGGERTREVLESLVSGSITLEKAVASLAPRNVEASSSVEEMTEIVGNIARIDYGRAKRTGLPEVVYAEGKTVEHIKDILGVMHREALLKQGEEGSARVAAMATRLSPEVWAEISHLPDLHYYPTARIAALHIGGPKAPTSVPANLGRYDVAVVCAGTSDVGVSEEAAVTCELFGLTVNRLYDVGVAGLHRLLAHVPVIREAKVTICIAGMDGALPSVVGGLAKCPVVAVPTSVGYGAAFGGVAPLLTMLNACAPGVSVVNIDNGFGAAMVAKKIIDVEK